MAAITYNINDHVTNTTFVGVQFTVTLNGDPVDLTDGEIKMNVKRRDVVNSQNYEFTIGAGLTLITPKDGVFAFDSQVITIPAAKYKYDITFYLSDGSIHNFIKGEWNLTENI